MDWRESSAAFGRGGRVHACACPAPHCTRGCVLFRACGTALARRSVLAVDLRVLVVGELVDDVVGKRQSEAW